MYIYGYVSVNSTGYSLTCRLQNQYINAISVDFPCGNNHSTKKPEILRYDYLYFKFSDCIPKSSESLFSFAIRHIYSISDFNL